MIQIDDTKQVSMKYFMDHIHAWRSKYQKNKEGDIIIQNKKLLSNVRLTDNGLNVIQKHSRGFENIPLAIEKPDEVWSWWGDVQKQHVVLRAYILFGKVNYIVLTKDGIIEDAFAANNTTTEKYRKGAILHLSY